MFCPIPSQSMVELAFGDSVEFVMDDAIGEQSFSALTERREDMRVGSTYYRFMRPATVNYIRAPRGWTSYISSLVGYVGEGATPERAFGDLSVQIHTNFQVLLRKRPFEMNGDEQSKWVQLTSVIDLLYYKTTTPIVTHEIGRVSFARIARPHHIEWINSTPYPIDPEKVPAELMSCRTGQWIEAVVRRNPVSHAILGIESIRKISFRIPSESELNLIWEAMPEANVESSEWVW